MTKLSIGWSSSTDLHGNLYRSHVGQMLFAGNKYLLLKRITVQEIHQSKNRLIKTITKSRNTSTRGNYWDIMVQTKTFLARLTKLGTLSASYQTWGRNNDKFFNKMPMVF
jgi:hypothetical protein